MGFLITRGTGWSVVERAQGWNTDTGGNRYLDGLGVSGRHSLRAPSGDLVIIGPPLLVALDEITTLAERVAAALEEMR